MQNAECRMQTGQPAVPSRPRRRIPRWAWVVACILLALALLILIPRLIVRHQINAELAAMRAEGYPTTLAELDAWYQYPSGANAADILTTAFACYVDTSTNHQGVPIVTTEKLPPYGEPLPEDMKSRIAAYLSDNAKAIELLHKGAAIPACRFPIALKQGPAVLLPHLATIRNVARLLELEAITAAENGEPEKAAGALVAGMELGRSLRNEPLIISQFVRFANQAIVCNGAARALSRIPLPGARLQQLAALAAEEEDSTALERGFAGETCSINSVLEQMGGRNRFVQTLMRATGLFEAERLRYLRSSRRTIALAKLPPKDAIAGAQEMEKKLQEAAKRRIPLFPDLSAMLVLPWERAYIENARDIARLRTMCAALAVERFRLAKWTLPEKLADLKPEFLKEIPADPFDGKPLCCKKEEKGYVIYSIGPNLKEEGGRNEWVANQQKTDDIAFRVAR